MRQRAIFPTTHDGASTTLNTLKTCCRLRAKKRSIWPVLASFDKSQPPCPHSLSSHRSHALAVLWTWTFIKPRLLGCPIANQPMGIFPFSTVLECGPIVQEDMCSSSRFPDGATIQGALMWWALSYPDEVASRFSAEQIFWWRFLKVDFWWVQKYRYIVKEVQTAPLFTHFLIGVTGQIFWRCPENSFLM
jgi:hypothetical protein